MSRMAAAAMLVIASPTAMRPDAGASTSASGVRSPMRHRLAAMGVIAHQRDRDIRHRHLPRTDHLVARREAADGAIADADEECLVRDAGQPQHPMRGILHVEFRPPERRQRGVPATHVARHPRWLAQQHFERHVDRTIAEEGIGTTSSPSSLASPTTA